MHTYICGTVWGLASYITGDYPSCIYRGTLTRTTCQCVQTQALAMASLSVPPTQPSSVTNSDGESEAGNDELRVLFEYKGCRRAVKVQRKSDLTWAIEEKNVNGKECLVTCTLSQDASQLTSTQGMQLQRWSSEWKAFVDVTDVREVVDRDRLTIVPKPQLSPVSYIYIYHCTTKAVDRDRLTIVPKLQPSPVSCIYHCTTHLGEGQRHLRH